MLTLLLLASRLSAVPPLSDPLGGHIPDSLRLSVPPLYLVLAPLFTLWDGISMLSMTRLHGFLVGLAGLYLVGRIVRHILVRPPLKSWRTWVAEIGTLLISLGGLLAFIVIGALWHRPMLSLTTCCWTFTATPPLPMTWATPGCPATISRPTCAGMGERDSMSSS